MRLLLTVALLLSASLARAQPADAWSHALALGDATGRIDVAWHTRGSRRSATVTARVAGPDGRPGPVLELHDGPTVRTAAAADGERACVVVLHGGDEHPFVRAHLLAREDMRLVRTHQVDIPIALGSADRRPRFPAEAVVTSTPRGFAVMVQHQERDTSADVVTTLTVLGDDGTEVEATHVVAVPWALADLVWSGEGYHLAVLWGGFSEATAGTARINLVRLDAAGTPREHPWWASAFVPVTEVELAWVAGEVVATWRDGATIVGNRWATSGGWSVEPPAPETFATLPADAVAWTLTVRAGAPTVIAAR